MRSSLLVVEFDGPIDDSILLQKVSKYCTLFGAH